MAACSTTMMNRCNSFSAVACTCAHIGLILDTALLAVSILIARIISELRT